MGGPWLTNAGANAKTKLLGFWAAMLAAGPGGPGGPGGGPSRGGVIAGDLVEHMAAAALVVVQEELEVAAVLVELATPWELAVAAGAVDSLSLLLLTSPLLPVLVQWLLIVWLLLWLLWLLQLLSLLLLLAAVILYLPVSWFGPCSA